MRRTTAALALAAALAACGTAPAAEEPTPTDPEAAAEAQPVQAVPTAQADGWQHSGAAFTLDAPVPAAQVFGTMDTFVDQTVRVEGRIADVCQMQGCWMVLRDDADRTVRIRMKDHAFSVAKDTTGQWADLEGKVVANDPDPDEAAHFADEATHPEVAPEGEGKERTYEIIASAVRIKKDA